MLSKIAKILLTSTGGLLLAAPAWALPGQSAPQAVEWIRTNAFLRPRPGETLLINRSEPDGSRFSFLASVAPPGRIVPPLDRETIRSQRMTFFRPRGLTAQDLEQAIADVYGPEIAADLAQAREVLRYPVATASGNTLQRAIQGVVRQGSQFVYWLELTQNPDGSAQQGQVVVFQAEFLPKVQEELAQRHGLTATQPSPSPSP